jgi:hypothetical protein
MRELVHDFTMEAIAMAPVPEELRRVAKTHPRITSFVDKMTVELQKVPKIDREGIRSAVYDMTNFMLRCIDVKANEMMMSDAAKEAIQTAAAKAKRMDELANQINRATPEQPAVIDAEEIEDLANG